MKLKNIHLYNYVIIYASNCDLYIKKSDDEIFIPHKTIAILEKNISFDVTFIRKSEGILYERIDLDDETITTLKNIIEPLVHISIESFTQKRDFKDRIFKIKSTPLNITFFEKLKNREDLQVSMAYKLAYLASKCEDITKLALSLYSSVAFTFTEKINRVILSDISKKWKLSDIAEQFNISEISIRKKLDQERTNFNQLLLDARMNQAIKHLIKNEKQISTISELIGYSSISYFIKTFKNYYGLTPKQFEIGIRENLKT
ncbi:AraC family transcriptional regulator [Raoultella planticola]|uniref:AraC family transcriptional regulator n=1 Tax=Raoultella planticola TaxID=575 RepID=UPI0034E3C511